MVILLMVIYGSATMGATVHLHYCMDEFVGWSLLHNENEECGKCGMKENKTSCCKDEHKHFKLKADHQNAAIVDLINNIVAPAVLTSSTDFDFQTFLQLTESYSPCHAPPDIAGQRLHVLYCVFLI